MRGPQLPLGSLSTECEARKQTPSDRELLKPGQAPQNREGRGEEVAPGDSAAASFRLKNDSEWGLISKLASKMGHL